MHSRALAANLILNEIANISQDAKFIYSDDTNIFFTSGTVAEIHSKAEKALRDIEFGDRALIF